MLLRIVGQDCVCAICLGVAERFREANTLAGGYNLAKDSCSKNVVKVIQESNAFRMEGGQREKFKFCAEKGFRKNYLEGGGMRKERKIKEERLWHEKGRCRVLIGRQERKESVGIVGQRGISALNARPTNKRECVRT